ncbi:MAG: hypothetical protein COV46_08555 [Deltaproteobacteria bacterium CG11_big_fil_rev_8_21_14_0_20_49_13]|nr:MAG: hypothetical protein COV46_08555 [Deltaproteobacteria bacterium CG11_big_fil_rev_8_21_14_0_20_49_13]
MAFRILKISLFSALLVVLLPLASSAAKEDAAAPSPSQNTIHQTPATEVSQETAYDGDSLGDEFDYDGDEQSPFLKGILAEPATLMETAPLKLTLEDCLRISLEHNAKLQATGYGIDAAKAQLMEASAIGWPILNFEYRTAPVPQNAQRAVESFFSGEWSWWNRVKFDMGIPIYSFGKLSLAEEMARSGIQAAQTYAFQEKNSLVSKVRQLYYGILLAEEVGRLLSEAHKRLSDEIAKRENKDEESEEVSSPMDSLKMKVFLYDLERRLADARQKETLALEGLRVQMGLASGTVFTVFSNKLRPVEANLKSFADYVTVAMANRPDVKLLKAGLDVKRNQYLLEKKKWFPDLGVGAFFELGRTVGPMYNVTTKDDFDDPFSFTRAGFGVQLSSKWDFHGNVARISKAKSEYYKLNLEQMIAKEGIKLDVRDAFLRAKTSMGNLKAARDAEKAARQLLFLSQSNYDIGVGEQKDIVDALQLVLMTRGRYFEAVFDYNAALAQLDEKMGLLPEVAK